MDHDYECTTCGKGFNYDTGCGYNNCEPEFCSEDCMNDREGTLIDAAMDRVEDDRVNAWLHKTEGNRR